MKRYRVEITDLAIIQLRNILEYLYYVLHSMQAYESVKNDYLKTIDLLADVAGTLPDCNEETLRMRRLKKFHFRSHKYIILCRVDPDVVTIVEIHHEIEDY